MIPLTSAGHLAWRATLILNHPQIESLIASLSSEVEVDGPDGNGSYSVCLNESTARNLRAFWNTRMRSLEAAASVLSHLAKGSSSTGK